MASRCAQPVSGAGFFGIGLAFIGAALASDQPGLLGAGFALAGLALATGLRRFRGGSR